LVINKKILLKIKKKLLKKEIRRILKVLKEIRWHIFNEF
jgi:hypothetical protein